jgi:hypothetical protein
MSRPSESVPSGKSGSSPGHSSGWPTMRSGSVGKEERRQEGSQRHDQDDGGADQGAAIAREAAEEVHQRISMRGSSHI